MRSPIPEGRRAKVFLDCSKGISKLGTLKDLNPEAFLVSGLQKYNANKVLLEHQGVWMDPQTNEVVSPETGLPLAVSKMTVEQVFIELQMRDIPTTGTAEQRASRLQVRLACQAPLTRIAVIPHLQVGSSTEYHK